MPASKLHFLTATFSLIIANALPADVLLIGEAFQRAPEIVRQLHEAKVAVRPAEASALRQIDAAQIDLVVLAPERPLPPEVRVGLSRFLASGGHIVVVGAH